MGLLTPEDRVDDLCTSYNGSSAAVLGAKYIEIADPLHAARVIEPVDQILAYALNLAAGIRALQEAQLKSPEVVWVNTSGTGGDKWRHVNLLLKDTNTILADVLEKAKRKN